MEYYYKDKNLFYKPLPKFRNDCLGDIKNSMKFMYPTEKSAIFLPKGFDGKKNELILKVTHSNNDVILYWYLDNVFLGTTKEKHEFSTILNTGSYVISVTDNFGNEIHQEIIVKY